MKSIFKIMRIMPVLTIALAATVMTSGQYRIPGVGSEVRRVRPTVPRSYDDILLDNEYTSDLNTPSNVKTEIIFDPDDAMYYIHTRVGNRDIVTPYPLAPEDYNKMMTRRELWQTFRQRNSELFENKEREPFKVFDMDFDLGPLEKVFGPGGVKLNPRGSIQLSAGIRSNKTDNPSLPMRSRRKTYFNFDQKVQATVSATVGDKMKFNMGYNTDATFDFDAKNLKLNYEGKEDEIIKSIEAGNVSMTTGSSLLRGSTSLFGIKTKLQFGKLTLTGLVSRQNSESRSVGTNGGIQTTDFNIRGDQYDANRHFFLAQYFYDNYDTFASRLPLVTSGINISRIEVWVTNRNNNFNESRNIVAFMDLGENKTLASDFWKTNAGEQVPSNRSNDLLTVMKEQYPDARNINRVTQVLAPLAAYGINGGQDFEKVESARLLSPSEYTLNESLGYISLKSQLNTDEVLAVAFEYTWQGKVYQVGEFSSDVSDTEQSLYLKLLRPTTIDTRLPAWRLMMKNVYALGATRLQKSNFRLNVKYLDDASGTEIDYLPIPELSGKTLLQVMNLDRIDSNQESNPDGFFDFVEGYTVQTATGRIIFPVAEPFGRHLADAIGNGDLAKRYAYTELYDSTQVVAREFADRNKFSITGQYQASSGSTIMLGAMNVPRGSVVVTAGGTVLTENTDYTVDYAMGIVTITNQSIIDSGTSVYVSLENQSLFSMQRKSLLGLDAQYRFNPNLTIGATLLNYSEKALTKKVNIGEETVNNTMAGLNLNYTGHLPWLDNLLNKVPTINAAVPSSMSLNAEVARIMPKQQKSGSDKGSSYIDDFESTQTGIDLRNPYSWTLASTPAGTGAGALFPEALLSDNIDYGKNRALLAWNYIDRMWTQKNSSMLPGYLRNDLKQLSNPYVREVLLREIYPGRDVVYGESNYVQTLNLSFYPEERGPYNLDSENIDDHGRLLNPEKRWGGIMRKIDNPNFEASNVEYLEFWMLDPFLDEENKNREGGDLYFNFGEISEDILKDGMKSYENGLPINGEDNNLTNTVWGRVSKQNSLTYAFENAPDARPRQDVGFDGLPNEDEYSYGAYAKYVGDLRTKLSAQTLQEMESQPYSALNDPAGDNYHFYRSPYWDETKASILERYKYYNGVEGNSLSPDQSDNPQYQSARAVPDVEDINQDNTLNEYERYFEYKVSIRPEDLVVGKNYITDRRETVVPTREGSATAIWYQFKIPLSAPDKTVGGISDFSSIRFARMFMTGFRHTTHLRFAALELVRGEWRDYQFSLSDRDNSPAEGELDMTTVNIEENYGRKPVNYVLPPDVDRIQDPGQMQATQLNEQSLSMQITNLPAGHSKGAYKNTMLDLRIYKRLQMWIHAEAPIDDSHDLQDGDLAFFIRLGSDVKNNYYEYEIPLTLTPEGTYNNLSTSDREEVWPLSNRLNVKLDAFTNVKTLRNRDRNSGIEGINFNNLYSISDPEEPENTVSVLGNPSLADVRIIVLGVRNRTKSTKDGTVWLNELRVTDFNEDGGWAAKVNANVNLSDLASVNFAVHHESAGFGGVDQSLSQRRLDDYSRYDFSLQGDVGRALPSKIALSAPVFYSRSSEKNTPKYNPLDRDILLKDALAATETKQQYDSIRDYAVTRKTIESFSLSGLRFNIRSASPMPWDPANFLLSFSFNRQRYNNPTTEYQNANDYRGSLQYSYSPNVKPWRPMKRLQGKSKSATFLRDWSVNWMFNNLTFLSTISRYYFEEQGRTAVNSDLQLPVQVSKNFFWDRQLSLTWNLLQELSLSFSSNTTARIEETVGAVNKRLFPDKYREWRDTVWNSLKGLGTPWNYNQTFTGTYHAPFSKIPFLDFLTANATYTSTYRWDRGSTVDGLNMGNSIRNQTTGNIDSRLNFELLFNKSKRLREVNRRFGRTRQTGTTTTSRTTQRLRKLSRAVTLSPDSSTFVTHNFKTKKYRISATKGGVPFHITSKPKDDNSIEIITRGNDALNVTITEIAIKPRRPMLEEVADYSLRFLMSPRNFTFRYRDTHSLHLPQFEPEIGDIFGQSTRFGPLSPGLGFAFGLYDDSYIEKALDRGWLLTGEGMTSPALWNRGKEYNFELTLEPARGLKIVLTGNLTDNRTNQVQFMYAGMPTSMSGSYIRTHVALASALRSYKAENGYQSEAFSKFLDYIPKITERVEAQYRGVIYPSTGFLESSPLAGTPFNPNVSGVSPTSSDVLVPAFLAAYSGGNPEKITLSHFPGLSAVRPNWRVTYDGLINIGNMKNIFKSFTLSHTYQCTFSAGSYTSFMNWVSVGDGLGFLYDEVSGQPIPSSPYNLSSVSITERFAPLAGVNMTFKNNLSVNAEYRDARTVNLNSSAGQIVETMSRQFVFGAGIKIPNFNNLIRFGSSKGDISNDLSLNLDMTVSNNSALIRRIETAYTQATSGSRTFSLNFMANYQYSKRITLSAFFDHQINSPLVSNSAYPTTNTNYGLAINISLAQ